MGKSLPSHQRVRERFNYDPETGIVTRRIKIGHREAGTVVGSFAAPTRGRTGYLLVCIDGTTCKLHRVIFFYMTGRWPRSIDHINWDGLDNRWCNLRDVTQAENNRHRRRQSSSRQQILGNPLVVNGPQLLGTSQSNRTGRWQARINWLGKEIWLGTFVSPEEAHAVYVAKARELGVYEERTA